MPLAGTGPEWSPEKGRKVVDDSPRGRALAVDDSRTLFSLIDDGQNTTRTGPVPTSPCGCIIRMDEASEIRSLIKSVRATLARAGKGSS